MNEYFNVLQDRELRAETKRSVRMEDGSVLELPPRWFLSKLLDLRGRTVNSDDYTMCRLAAQEPLRVAVRHPGVAQDFSFTGLGVPVVTQAVGELIASVAPEAVQLIPATVDGHDGQYEVLNVLSCVSCVDEGRSDFERWTESDGRPDKVGHYKFVTNLVIDPLRAGDAHIFRLQGYDVVLAISGKLKDLLEQHGVKGVTYRRLTPWREGVSTD